MVAGRALVTGAGGFIGTRLVTRLASEAHVRALVRRGLARPAAAGDSCERVYGDVTDVDSLRPAMVGRDVVFHCAWGGSSLEEARRVNVDGTRNVMEAAARAGVRRVVHLSSMAVHGRRLPDVLDENHPLKASDPYGLTKAEGERVALALAGTYGIDVVVLRPTLVYGPRSPIWLVSYLERVKMEQLALIDGGRGIANLVYVDDLIDAMLAAATCSNVSGEAVLVSGPSPVTWREYIGQLARMCGKPLPPSVSVWRAWVEVQFWRVYGMLTQRPRRLIGMDFWEQTRQTRVSIERARHLLGYAPSVSLEDGMRRCEEWLRREGLLAAHGPAVAAAAERPRRSIAG